MKIALVEDDPLQDEPLKEHLEGKGFEVDLAVSAYQFQQKLIDFSKTPPDLFILDVMLPWQHRDDPDSTVPAGIDLRDRHLGVRCYEWLKKDPRLSEIPVILLTELEKSGSFGEELRLVPGSHYLRKERGYGNLDLLIRKLIKMPTKSVHPDTGE